MEVVAAGNHDGNPGFLGRKVTLDVLSQGFGNLTRGQHCPR